MEAEAEKITKDRNPRWEAWAAEVKGDEANFPRTIRKGSTVKGDKTTDCIYTITIGGTVAYVGQTNNFKARELQHATDMKLMRARNPEAEVKMQSIHGYKPWYRIPIPNKHGAPLNAMEEFFMDHFDTISDKTVDKAKEGVNRFRYNEKCADRKVNKVPTSPTDIERFKHHHKCDGPSDRPCDGDAEMTPEIIKRMIEEVVAARAQATQDAAAAALLCAEEAARAAKAAEETKAADEVGEPSELAHADGRSSAARRTISSRI